MYFCIAYTHAHIYQRSHISFGPFGRDGEMQIPSQAVAIAKKEIPKEMKLLISHMLQYTTSKRISQLIQLPKGLVTVTPFININLSANDICIQLVRLCNPYESCE